MRHWKFIAALAALIVTLGILYVAGQSARAIWQELGWDTDQIGLTDDYTLAGDRDGDLVIFANAIVLPEGSTVSGNATLVSNYAQLDAQIAGDLSASASQITIGPSAHIHGHADLTGVNVTIDGVIEGQLTVQASQVTLGADSQFGSEAVICASQLIDNRAGSATVIPCQPRQSVNPLLAAGNAAGLMLVAATVLAGGVLTALPHGLAPLRLARLDENLREHRARRLTAGVALFGLWLLLALLLTLLPGGPLTALLLILFLGASFVIGAPLVWLGLALAGLWIGLPLVRLARRPRASAPLAALLGGLIVCGALALAGPVSAIGLLMLGALAVIGLAGWRAARAAGAVGDSPRRTSYFVQG